MSDPKKSNDIKLVSSIVCSEKADVVLLGGVLIMDCEDNIKTKYLIPSFVSVFNNTLSLSGDQSMLTILFIGYKKFWYEASIFFSEVFISSSSRFHFCPDDF